MKEFYQKTARELLTALRLGEMGAEELTRAYLARIERYGMRGKLNAVSQVNPNAIGDAKKLDADASNRALPLFGLPVLVKENIDVKGLATTAGSRALTDNVATRDAEAIARLRAAGAIILGKTNMTEFANYTTNNMPGGFSSMGGQVVSAYGAQFNPSGSSSGSGVAMSAGLCAAALGTDTSFSVIACANVNGVAGLKARHGAVSQHGVLPISHTLDAIGPMTRDFSDALLLDSTLRGEPVDATPIDARDLRVAVNTFHRDMVSDEQMARYEKLFDRLRGAGARIDEASHPYAPEMRDIMRCEFKQDLENYLAGANTRVKTLEEILAYYARNPSDAPHGVDHLREASQSSVDDEAYKKALAERARLTPWLCEQLRPYDVCVMTGPTSLMHFIGLPSVALSLCMGEDGAPRGVILYGADERLLFSAALTMEGYCDGVEMPRLDA